MRRIIFPARKFHRRNPTRSTDGFLSPSLRRGPLRRRYLPRRNGSQEFHANGNDQETVRDRLAAIVGRWKMLFPAHRRLVEQSTPFGYRLYLLFSPGKNRFSDLVYGVSRLKIWFILSGGRGRIVFGRFYFELVLEEKSLCINVCDGDIYMERDDTRCCINLRKRRRERSVSSISRLIRNFGLHFSTLVSMSRRLRKTRGNVVRVMQRKWIYISTFERKLENPSSRIERFFPISSIERARIYMHIKVVGLFRNLWNRMIWGDAEKSLRSFWSHVHTLPSPLSSARARR